MWNLPRAEVIRLHNLLYVLTIFETWEITYKKYLVFWVEDGACCHLKSAAPHPYHRYPLPRPSHPPLHFTHGGHLPGAGPGGHEFVASAPKDGLHIFIFITFSIPVNGSREKVFVY